MPLIKRLLALAAAALTLGAAGGVARAQDASALLREAAQAPSHVSFAGQVETVQFGNAKSVATIYRVEHRAPDLTRRWYLAPQSVYGYWSVTRGDKAYNVDVKNRRIIASKNAVVDDQIALDDNFGLLTANYRAISGPDETIAGRNCAAVLLLNKYTGQTGMRLWIDKQTHLVLQKQVYAPGGAVTHETRYDQITYTTNLPAAIFRVPGIKGYATLKGLDHEQLSNDLESVVKTAGFQGRYPKYLPEGFTPIAGDVSDIKGVRTLHLLYSDGLRTLSLFENSRGAAVDLSRYKAVETRFENHDAQVVEDGPTRLMAWEESGLHFALVGELGRVELQHIAASVVP